MEDLQSLLEKINRDGVAKAEAQAKEIVDAAKVRAAEITARAKEESDRAKAAAEQAASDYQARAKETLAQAARDTVLTVEAAVTKLLERLLARNVDSALADTGTVASLAAEATKELAGGGEIAVAPKLAAALQAQLAGAGKFQVVLDETIDSGFSVRLDGGRVEHSFTGATVAAELARRLRPDLAALLK